MFEPKMSHVSCWCGENIAEMSGNLLFFGLYIEIARSAYVMNTINFPIVLKI